MIKNKSVCYILAILLASLGLFQYAIFSTNVVDTYAELNLHFNYNYGIFKRALAGSIYSYLNFLFNSSIDKFTYISFVHASLYLFFVVGIVVNFLIVVQKFRVNSIIMFVITLVLLSSYFVKNLILLKGYLDIYVFVCLVWAVALSLLRFHTVAFLIACFACFFHEETLFFYIPFLISEIATGHIKVKAGIVYVSLFTVLSLYVTFVPFPEEHYKDFFNDGEYTVAAELARQEYADQHNSVLSLVRKQFFEIKDNIHNFIFAYIYLILPSALLLVLVLFHFIKHGICNKYLILVTVICVGAPATINFVAIDLWRIVSFSCFSIWIVLITALTNQRMSIVKSKIDSSKKLDCLDSIEFNYRYIVTASVVMVPLSFFYIMLPNLYISLQQSFWIGGVLNSSFYTKYLQDCFPYRFAENFADFYIFRNGDKDQIMIRNTLGGGIVCAKNGTRHQLPQFSYGRKTMVVRGTGFSEFDNYPLVQFGPYTWEVKPNINNVFEFEIDRKTVLAGNYYLFFDCLPYVQDWTITSLAILDNRQLNNRESQNYNIIK